MDVDSFCGMMQTEINFLKAKLNDIMRTVEKSKSTEKMTHAAQLTELHALIEHLSEMNNKLSKTCPLDWSREKQELESKKTELLQKIDMWDSEHIAGLVDN